MKTILLFAACLLLAAASARAQSAPNALLAALAKEPHAQYLIEASAAITYDSSIKILNFEGNNKYRVIFTRIPQNIEIKHWHSVLPSEKYNPNLLEITEKDGNSVLLLLSIDSTVQRADAEAKLANLSAAILPSKWNSNARISIRAKPKVLNLIAALPFVLYISPSFSDQSLASYARAYTGADVAQSPISFGGFGLSGSGVTLGDGDDGAPLHIDITDRLSNFNPVLTNTHGIHTTGTAAGAGIKDERYKGFAPKANIIGQFFSAIISYAPTLYQDVGMRVTNNSYAAVVGDCSYAGTYDVYSQLLDQQAMELPQLLHVFAAGNDAYLSCGAHPSGYGTVTGAYQPAKNVLVIANIGKTLQTPNNYSSRGPVKDGRLKPEVTAMGVNLISTVGNNSYAPNTGTSMACPNVAGSAALMYELYKSLHGGSNPPAALIKAVLMNSSRDLGTAGPDYRYGFGLLDAGAAAEDLSQGHYIVDSCSLGESKTYSIAIPSNVAKAKIMLYWSDPAASPSAAKALVNDLNLRLGFGGTTFKPLVLNPANALAPALPGNDTLNNVEQITLSNPSPGNYIASISFDGGIASRQHFIVAYSFETNDLELQSPLANQVYIAGDSAYSYFKCPAGTATFTASISTDNGATYTLINNNIAADQRHVAWLLPAGTASSSCRIKISENGTARTATSSAFVVSPRIMANLAGLTEQCPGSIKMVWTAIPDASAYVVFRNVSGNMAPVDTISSASLHYTFSGLDAHKEQWVSVAPIIGGKTAIRAIALSRTPADGSCSSGPASDLALVAKVSPESGRLLTSTALSGSTPLELTVSNQSVNVQSAYALSYSLNGGPLLSQVFHTPIAPGAKATLTLSDHPIDFSSAASYNIKAVVTNLAATDLIPGNDSLNFSIKQVANPPFNIIDGELENFESTSQPLLNINIVGMEGADSWDFLPSSGLGRARNFVQSQITIEGSKSMSMDLSQNASLNPDSVSTNQLIKTLNLAGVDMHTDELRLQLEYTLHGAPKFAGDNAIFVRGSDSSTWIKAYTFDTTSIGNIQTTGSISLNDLLMSNGQLFSSSTQIMIQQKDTSLICGIDYGNGLTIDKVKIYPVDNDVALLSIDIPGQSCALAHNTPIKVKLRNNVFYTLYNIAVSYQIDNGPVTTEYIDSISAKDTLAYTFAATANFEQNNSYDISSYLHLPDDSYRANDSLLHVEIHNQYLRQAPYAESLRDANTGFYTHTHSAWRLGRQSFSPNQGAANAPYAWVGSASDQDSLPYISYLYTPCYQLNLAQPTLSITLLYNFENEDTANILNAGFVEYTSDGINWQPLADDANGYRWYPAGKPLWADSLHNYWHVASVALPLVPTISFRFGIKGGFQAQQGMAIGGMYVHDGEAVLNATASLSAALLADSSSGSPTYSAVAQRTDSISASINVDGPEAGSFLVNSYKHLQPIPQRTFLLPYSFSIHTSNTYNGIQDISLFVPDTIFSQNTPHLDCDNCILPRSIYDLSILAFTSYNSPNINGSLEDNATAATTYIPNHKINYLPFANGYIAQFQHAGPSEYWWYDAGPQGTLMPNELGVSLTARQIDIAIAKLYYDAKIDTSVQTYFIEQLTANGWQERGYHASQNVQPAHYEWEDSIIVFDNKASWRIRYLLKDGRTRYSNTTRIDLSPRPILSIFPNPIREGKFTIAYNFPKLAPIHIRIVDERGRIVFRKTENPQFRDNLSINMQQLSAAPGIYLVTVTSGDISATEKIVFIK